MMTLFLEGYTTAGVPGGSTTVTVKLYPDTEDPAKCVHEDIVWIILARIGTDWPRRMEALEGDDQNVRNPVKLL